MRSAFCLVELGFIVQSVGVDVYIGPYGGRFPYGKK